MLLFADNCSPYKHAHWPEKSPICAYETYGDYILGH